MSYKLTLLLSFPCWLSSMIYLHQISQPPSLVIVSRFEVLVIVAFLSASENNSARGVHVKWFLMTHTYQEHTYGGPA